MSADATDYSAWIGKREETADRVSAGAVARMSATLDRGDPPPRPGDPLPPLWHWMLFGPRERTSELCSDGHPRRGSHVPPVTLPRRMFAGDRCTFHAPLHVGEEVRRVSEIAAVTPKTGATGELLFVDIRHEIFGRDGLAIEEVQNIVYRGVSAPAHAPTGAAPQHGPAQWTKQITPDPVLLFRYSALTFNGHRIHYDRPYTMEQENYPGLVVHGPLVATLLIELLRDNASGRAPATFSFRARRPLFDTAPFTLEGGLDVDGNGFRLEAIDGQGWPAMEARGAFAG